MLASGLNASGENCGAIQVVLAHLDPPSVLWCRLVRIRWVPVRREDEDSALPNYLLAEVMVG
eukprot:2914142-Rhodomonas_salina.1